MCSLIFIVLIWRVYKKAPLHYLHNSCECAFISFFSHQLVIVVKININNTVVLFHCHKSFGSQAVIDIQSPSAHSVGLGLNQPLKICKKIKLDSPNINIVGKQGFKT